LTHTPVSGRFCRVGGTCRKPSPCHVRERVCGQLSPIIGSMLVPSVPTFWCTQAGERVAWGERGWLVLPRWQWWILWRTLHARTSSVGQIVLLRGWQSCLGLCCPKKEVQESRRLRKGVGLVRHTSECTRENGSDEVLRRGWFGGLWCW
jgi:hypothetical protein